MVEHQHPISAFRLPWFLRTVLIFAGIGLATLLVTARVLKPSPSGKGTHQQLGLPPCSFEVWFDRPCPSCGMTTSWSLMTRGQVVQSVRANPGGAMLAICSILLAPWTIVSGLVGRWFIQPPNDRIILIVGFSIILVTLAHWAFRFFA